MQKRCDMKNVQVARLAIFSLLAIAVILLPSLAKAELSILDKGGLKMGLSLEMAAGVFSSQNLNYFGDAEEDKGYFDGYIKPVLNLSYATSGAGNFYGGLSYAATGSYGDDIPGLVTSNSEGFKSEQAYIGWKSGTLLSALGEDVFDISIGEQEFQIGDGFLIYDGEFDGRYGAYWTAPHKSFDETAIVRLNTQLVRADFFYLKSDADYADTELYGINVEHVNETLGTLGAAYMKVTDSNDGVFLYENRKGMDLYSIRGQGTPFASAGLENLFLAFEYANESNGDRVEKDASAWYAEAGYTLAALPWNPTLSYRYAFFSGDEDATDSEDQNWDPMFYGFSRGWGTHFMGEIVGEYFLFNSNQKTQMVKLNLQPTDCLDVGAIYYDFKLDEKNVYGAPVTSDEFASEVNLYADYAVNDNLWLTAVFAYARPETAWKEVNGGTAEDTKLFEIAAFLYF